MMTAPAISHAFDSTVCTVLHEETTHPIIHRPSNVALRLIFGTPPETYEPIIVKIVLKGDVLREVVLTSFTYSPDQDVVLTFEGVIANGSHLVKTRGSFKGNAEGALRIIN